jgi:flagellar biosynthesis protein FlhA
MVDALTLQLSNIWRNFALPGLSSLAIPLVLFCIIVMMVIPLPPILLDLFFTANIALSLIIVMICISALKPLDFSSFPTVLLFATLLRLALNVASTRVVLVDGHTGPDAAGNVIEAFGEFIIAGNYLIGIIVFSILMIINFVVVTKGAGRVSEVTARFTLDAMPGKQMAIDADLNAGILTKEEAKARRAEVAAESEFYGSMDGASKFVKGDVIAGLIILMINMVGGLIIGTAFHDMSFTDAAQTYVLLTIGDGLVAQIPSLLLATATAIIVTRVSADTKMHSQLTTQMGHFQPLAVTSGVLLILGMIPGMPNMMFLLLAAMSGGLAYYSFKNINKVAQEPEISEEEAREARETAELSWDDVPKLDVIGLEVGYALIPLIDKEQGGNLMQRIKGVRKKLSHELGFLVQTVHIRDNLDLSPNQYRININGVVRGQGELMPGRELAINPGVTHGTLSGKETRDPAFGLEATWIDVSQKEYAQTLGFTVVDASTTLATHLNKILQENAKDLLGHDEAQQLLDQLASSAPKLVESLVPKKISLGVFTAVLQNLLDEGVPIRNMKGIVEVLSHHADKTQDPDQLTSAVRPSLGRMIVQSLAEIGEDMSVMTLEPDLEQLLHTILQQGAENGENLEPNLAEQLLTNLYHASEDLVEQGIQPVLIVSPSIRPWVAKFVRHRVPGLAVLGFNEIPDEQGIKVVRTIERKGAEQLPNE